MTEFENADAIEVSESALMLPEEWMLIGGNHRCCAIYLLDPLRWEVRLMGEQPWASCLDALPCLA
jgi:hypothetical protein